jgi:hypothetical protein
MEQEMTFWSKLAAVVSVVLRNKLRTPLTGDDMVLVISAYRELLKSKPDE